MPRPKSIVRCHKSGTGGNQDRQQTTPHDNRCYTRKDIHLKSNEFSSSVISVSPPLNNSVTNTHQLSSVVQQISRSSQNTLCDNRCFNNKDSNSKSNELSSLVIHLPSPLNDSVNNLPKVSSVRQQLSRS